MICDIDKVRFVDSEGSTIHAVELSDHRSDIHFITIYHQRTTATDEWKRNIGADNYHNPSIFHRDDEKQDWVLKYYDDKSWSHHFHEVLEQAPTVGDLDKYKSRMSDELMGKLESHLKEEGNFG